MTAENGFWYEIGLATETESQVIHFAISYRPAILGNIAGLISKFPKK